MTRRIAMPLETDGEVIDVIAGIITVVAFIWMLL